MKAKVGLSTQSGKHRHVSKNSRTVSRTSEGNSMPKTNAVRKKEELAKSAGKSKGNRG